MAGAKTHTEPATVVQAALAGGDKGRETVTVWLRNERGDSVTMQVPLKDAPALGAMVQVSFAWGG